MRFDRLGEAEVEHLDGSVGPHLDVGRLQIAVHDALLVRGVQGIGNLVRQQQGVAERDASRGNAVGERRPVDELHHQRLAAIGALEAVDHRDVGMAERGEGPGFPLEARETIGVLRDRLGQDLDCDLPPEVRIGGPIHFAHPTHADLGDDFIRADARAGLQRHMRRAGLYETHSPRAAQTCPFAPRPL